MTTAHKGDTPDAVAFFFVTLTNFDDHDFSRYLVLFVGADGVARQEVMERVAHYAKPTLSGGEAG